MAPERILWIDDEIELLKPHLIFLRSKGYELETANNGHDALEMLESRPFDLILLDENMPGMGGLEALARIKALRSTIPVVMVTKSEEEHLMESAIGAQISDYLIKPVNPNQLLLSLKKNLEARKWVDAHTEHGYQQEFRQLGLEIGSASNFEDWSELYRKLVRWDLELERLGDGAMREIYDSQKSEANALFRRFIEKNYADWISEGSTAPDLSHTVLQRNLLGALGGGKPVFLVVIDNLRYDQWKVIEPEINELFRIESEKVFCSILPTATQYARNSLFSGLMPLAIKSKYPKLWIDESSEESKNQHEAELFSEWLKRHGKGELKMGYHKVVQLAYGRKLVDGFKDLSRNDISVIVFNFVDMLSHSKTEMEVIKELADNDKAYRSLTRSWFVNSPLYELLKKMSEIGAEVALTTDHGTIHVTEPVKVAGDRSLNSNLRYKVGRNLGYEEREVVVFKKPEQIQLPVSVPGSAFLFARESDFFAYPNNYNHYVKYYRNTYQHGGVSMEEMLVPFVWMKGRG